MRTNPPATDNSDMPQMKTTNLQSLLDFQKMVFIYNAVNDGWTVKQLDDGRYEFRKRDRRVTSDTCLDTYLRGFIQYYRELQQGHNRLPQTGLESLDEI